MTFLDKKIELQDEFFIYGGGNYLVGLSLLDQNEPFPLHITHICAFLKESKAEIVHAHELRISARPHCCRTFSGPCQTQFGSIFQEMLIDGEIKQLEIKSSKVT